MSRFDIANEPSAEQIRENYKNVVQEIQSASQGRPVELVAVSKTKSPGCMKHLYDAGQRVFGENYVQEIVEKAPLLPEDITWHFVGHLQSNKVRELLMGVPTLQVIETIDTARLASKVNKGCEEYRQSRPLDIFIQINTSGEEAKSGVEPGEPAVQLARYITSECDHLRLRGVMTIGMLDYTSKPENFMCLCACREDIAKALEIPPAVLHLSMGMSADYVNAIKMGSTLVRVGTSLFGQRYYPPKQ